MPDSNRIAVVNPAVCVLVDNAGNARLPGKPDHSSHRFHLEQHYTKRMFSTLEGKLAEAPTMTASNAL